MTTAAKILVLTSFALAGCNLAVPVGQFEFAEEDELIIIRTDQGGGPEPDSETPEQDLAPQAPPELVITELLIHSSNSQTLVGERGEYIEVKNIGAGPADPRNISLVLIDPNAPDAPVGRIQVAQPTSQEEFEVYSGLQPILPEEYFVFVRYDTAAAPIAPETGAGHLYDYGRYASGPALPNDLDRILELRYTGEQQIETFDAVRFRFGEIRRLDGEGTGLPYSEDVAIGVRKDAEDSESNDLPENWCLAAPFIGTGPVRGTPGRVSQCD